MDDKVRLTTLFLHSSRNNIYIDPYIKDNKTRLHTIFLHLSQNRLHIKCLYCRLRQLTPNLQWFINFML